MQYLSSIFSFNTLGSSVVSPKRSAIACALLELLHFRMVLPGKSRPALRGHRD
jgi:hypothetical protein